MTDEIKPCPFCGATSASVQNGDTVAGSGPNRKDAIYFLSVWCPDCNAEGGRSLKQENAIAAWNTRAVDAELAALRERVKVLEGALKPFADIDLTTDQLDSDFAWDILRARAALKGVADD